MEPKAEKPFPQLDAGGASASLPMLRVKEGTDRHSKMLKQDMRLKIRLNARYTVNFVAVALGIFLFCFVFSRLVLEFCLHKGELLFTSYKFVHRLKNALHTDTPKALH